MCLDVKKVLAIGCFQELGIPEEVVIHQALEQIPSDFILSKRVNGAPATALRNADVLEFAQITFWGLMVGFLKIILESQSHRTNYILGIDGWVCEDNSRIKIPSTIKITKYALLQRNSCTTLNNGGPLARKIARFPHGGGSCDLRLIFEMHVNKGSAETSVLVSVQATCWSLFQEICWH
jgi:hypothetical protein